MGLAVWHVTGRDPDLCGIAYIVAFIMMKIVHVPRGRRGIFINMVVNDNCLFIGLPVQIALFGPRCITVFLAVLYW